MPKMKVNLGTSASPNWVVMDANDADTVDGKHATDFAPSSHTHTDVVAGGASGFMSGADKTKLNGIATGANNYTHPTGDGNLHVPATGTSNNTKVLKAGSTAGSISWAAVDWSELSGKPTSFTPASHTHVASDITQDSTHRFATDTEKATWNAKAPIDSPSFTGTPVAPTADGSNLQQITNVGYVDQALAGVKTPRNLLLLRLNELEKRSKSMDDRMVVLSNNSVGDSISAISGGAATMLSAKLTWGSDINLASYGAYSGGNYIGFKLPRGLYLFDFSGISVYCYSSTAPTVNMVLYKNGVAYKTLHSAAATSWSNVSPTLNPQVLEMVNDNDSYYVSVWSTQTYIVNSGNTRIFNLLK
ncbi:hypothetical protein [Paenibacillus sp. MMO-177]|uniref:hypothetical protein n=1 Tax=Paenibacillus sp. MMO-177 TaxID=3081289 RepID=UPI003019CF34